MSGLAIQRSEVSAARRWFRRLALAGGMMLIVGAVVWGGMTFSHPTAPRRQIARIMILPDTPPPPPPPERQPPPTPQETPQAQVEQPKPETPPEPVALKEEGAAGDAPSPFQAGAVKNDYIGGDIGNGNARFAAYVSRVEQSVQAELTRHKVHVNNIRLFLWLSADGSIERYSVEGGDGNTEKSVRLALAEFKRLDEAPQSDMPMPIGLRVN